MSVFLNIASKPIYTSTIAITTKSQKLTVTTDAETQDILFGLAIYIDNTQ